MNEEAGSSGAQAVVDRKFESDLILTLEPTNTAVVNAQKGIFWFEVSTKGVACHGSTPELGRSAIESMGNIVHWIFSDLAPRLAKNSDPVLGAATLNVGAIMGGNKINIVPERCRIEIDCRFTPSCGFEKIRGFLQKALRQIAPEATMTILRCAPSFHTSESIPWVERLGREAKGFVSSSWYSDAGALNSPHSPSVCIGPGHIAQAHTADEFISVAELEAGTAFFQHWIATAEKAMC